MSVNEEVGYDYGYGCGWRHENENGDEDVSLSSSLSQVGLRDCRCGERDGERGGISVGERKHGVHLREFHCVRSRLERVYVSA